VPAPPVVSPWPLTKVGHKRHPVHTVQYLLRANDHPVVVDGVFGPACEKAVRTFQESKRIAVDGVVGPKTWVALIIQVAQGSRGEAVRGVQEEFNLRQLAGTSIGLTADGVFGPETDAAVRAFQGTLGLTVDGIVGALTWRALVSGMLLS